MSKARMQIRNKAQAIEGLSFAIARLGDTQVKLYREVVGKIFRRVLNQTPQYSGKAVAHWTIGVNTPEIFSDDSLGRQDEKLSRSLTGELRPLQRGSPYWIGVAWRREKPKIESLRRSDKVFIRNGALGDTDNGGSDALYMESLQDSAYWMTKLRDVNRPYEVVADSVAHVMGQYWSKRVDPFKVYVPDYGD